MSPRPRVTVVGLGPAGPDLLPASTVDLLGSAGDRGYLRTRRHPAAARFAAARSCDDLYEQAHDFDEVYERIVERLVAAAAAAAPDPVVYAVPGSPFVAERTVDLLRADQRVEVAALPAPSFLDLAWGALGIDPVDAGVRIVDAAAFARLPACEPGPFLVAQCWSRHLLSEVKLRAADDAGPPAARAVLLHHLGLGDEVVAEVDWWDLDRTIEPDHLTSLFVPEGPGPAGPVVPGPGAARSAGEETARLAELMRVLRAECPWDREQTHASLMPHLVEECYEVLDALEAVVGEDARRGEGAAPGADERAGRAGASAHLREELGDLLFQIVFHACLAEEEAEEEDRFDLADVARGVHDKLVRRHPHVFADVTVDGAAQVVRNWEAIKKDEKGRRSVTEGIPSGLPALLLTTKLARKAAAVGLDPLAGGTAGGGPDTAAGGGEGAGGASAVLTALARRARSRAPVADEPAADEPAARDDGTVARQVGEVLFVVATVAQRLGVDAEQALRRRALVLRDEIRGAEGVPEAQPGSR